MTVVAVMVSPPRPGLVLPELAATSPLSEAEAADLYAAMVQDAMDAVVRSGGDLLVNYRSDATLPEEFVTDTDAQAAVRALVADAVDASDVRFEEQVGSTPAARAGNTVTHLLREEGAQSVAVVRGNSPFVTRSGIDSAAMKLRSAETVVGPGTNGEVYYAGFTEPVDFTDAFAAPEVSTLAGLARAADNEVDFLPVQPTVHTGEDLARLLPYLSARLTAERIVPTRTAAVVHDLGLEARAGDDGTLELVREDAESA